MGNQRTMYQPDLDKSKLKDLMLYLAYECRDANHFGSTKLCKLLYYCDFAAYLRNGKAITGSEYVNQPQGPMPRLFYDVRTELVNEQAARIEALPVFQHRQERLVPIGDVSQLRSNFSDTELETIDETLNDMKDMTAAEASDYSHGEVGWIITEIGETIPYETAHVVSERNDELNAVIDAAMAAWRNDKDADDAR